MAQEERPANLGVINPYALAEAKIGKKVNWKSVTEPHKLLESQLGMPYKKLFDPANDSPLYPGLKYDSESRKLQRISMKAEQKDTCTLLMEKAIWADPGDFFEEGAEMNDPVQGAVANCYFIAALSSVAWARPYVIAQRTRATGTGQQQFVDMVELFDNKGKASKVEVSELLPLGTPGNYFLYARSSEAGEIWPAIYEKAFAKWLTKDTGDRPNICKTAYGDCVGALVTITGLTPGYYFDTPSISADAIYSKVRQNCISKKTFNPLVAWTYSSGSASPDKVVYADACLVANHCYSILGWEYVNNKKYLIIRNPWGGTEACKDTANITWVAWDQPYYSGPGWWRPVPMANPDGIFALGVETFKKYFAGFGWVKTPEAP